MTQVIRCNDPLTKQEDPYRCDRELDHAKFDKASHSETIEEGAIKLTLEWK